MQENQRDFEILSLMHTSDMLMILINAFEVLTLATNRGQNQEIIDRHLFVSFSVNVLTSRQSLAQLRSLKDVMNIS